MAMGAPSMGTRMLPDITHLYIPKELLVQTHVSIVTVVSGDILARKTLFRLLRTEG